MNLKRKKLRPIGVLYYPLDLVYNRCERKENKPKKKTNKLQDSKFVGVWMSEGVVPIPILAH
jgi:hypothetical protein